ncbi:MAG: glycoside hydrolase family 3 C-terminal domain-containing protein [Bacteroidales bacterium]|nr:glycoside hydrolase family 3 C-terminal domain-containing protein [Bacteroidales bacterium]
MLKPQILLAAICISVAAMAQTYPFQDKSLSPEQRADDLISRLTLEEKTALTLNASEAIPRLGIKAYDWWNEALHGVGRNGSATTFPMPIAMAASFDDALVEAVFTAVSDEARVKHRIADEAGPIARYQGLTFWTPNINIFRDPRWGRGMETYGEDPYLMGQMGMAVVRGLQGPDDSPVRKLFACAKHYAVHSGPETERHRFDARPTRRDLYETYLPAFKDLVTKAGVEQVMTAYNRFEGQPCSANDYLIDTVLRGKWNYKGVIVSDCWAVADFYIKGRHEYVETKAEAAALAVKYGVDVECGHAYQAIPEAIKAGLLTEAELDRNLKRVIIARIRLGEMDSVDPWADLPESIVEGPDNKALAQFVAEKSIVLLQNKGILPLAPDVPVALIGPNADDTTMQWGNYSPIPKETITLLAALKDRQKELKYVKGCGHLDAAEPFDGVLAALDGVETVVFASGITPFLEGEQGDAGGFPGFEGGDRTVIELPQVQRDLIAALHEAGKKIILVNFSGSAMALEKEAACCDAIIQAWYPGQMGGLAIANILYGDCNPSGKLPLTFYASTGQLPDFSDYSMKDRTYRFFTGKPQWVFGYGQSYTTFKIGRVHVKGGNVVVKVRNTGKFDGDEVVQLYISRKKDKDGPIRTLRAYKRVFVPAGETVTVEIPLTEETFLWWSEKDQDMVPTHGRYVLQVGSSSAKEDLRCRRYRF